MGTRRTGAMVAAASVLTLLASVAVDAHGVAAGDKAFILNNPGRQMVPFLYLGAKHMVTGYDHLLFLVGVIFFLSPRLPAARTEVGPLLRYGRTWRRSPCRLARASNGRSGCRPVANSNRRPDWGHGAMTGPEPIGGRPLALATLVAAVVAAIVLLIAVLPAEYGLDPTGLGRRMGFLRLSGGDAGSEESAGVDNDNDDEPPAVYAVDVRWRLRRVPLAEQSGSSTRTNDEQRVELPLKIPNLTAVSARLTWDRRNDENFDLEIVAPDGRHGEPAAAPDAHGPGTLSAVLRWREVPAPQVGRDAIHHRRCARQQ